MEIFETIWGYVLPIGGGITIGSVIIAIGSIVIKTVVDKTMKKIDIEKIEEKAVEKGVEKVKTYTFKHNIQPVVKSELQKVVEVVDDKVETKLDQVDKKYDLLIECFEKFTAYFDNSIGVPEEKKKELKETLAKAKNGDYSVENFAIEETTIEKETTATSGNKAVSVER